MEAEGKTNGHENHPDEREPFFSAFEGTSVEHPGTQIGRFKLLSVLGEGGYGIVYLAEQERPMRRRVALKIIKPGMDSKEVLARFESERQALALLDHAHIAHVFTSGATDVGRPYFVMEYVDGQPITEYCDQHQLSIEDRLRLFQQVCEAVQHAHQKGIIHRDLKPSNILVSTQNDRPVSKIIDFGVARATSQPLTDRTLYTARGQMVGTPEYMSPEQADMAFEGIDTRSDVYSMGAVLYELLAGTLPFDPDTLRQGGAEGMRKTLREQEPPRPSSRFVSLGEEAKKIAQRRCTEISSLTRRLHRELEWIPLKALRKDRTRRYQSAAELAQDIQNYLDGTPLLAGPESISYKLCKFVVRHKASVVSTIAIVGFLVAGLVVSSGLYVMAKQAQKVSEQRAESLRRTNYGNSIALAELAYRDGLTTRGDEFLASCPSDLRGWEWDWLSYVSDEAEVTLLCRPLYKAMKMVTSIVLSQDEHYVFASSEKGGIQVWNLEDRSEIMHFWAGGWILSIDLDSKGRRLVSGTMNGAMKLWDAKTGAELITFQEGAEAYSSDISKCVFSVAFSPDDKLIVSGNEDKTATVWDAETGKTKMVLKGHTGRVNCAKFSPDGKRILTGSEDKTLKVWDAATGHELQTFRGHTSGVLSAVYGPREMKIASGSMDKTIKIWNAQSGVEFTTLRGHSMRVTAAAFSPDAEHVVSGSYDTTVKVWDIDSGANIKTCRGHGGSVTSVLFCNNGKHVISGSGEGQIKVWNPKINRGRTILYGHKVPIWSIAFIASGKRLISGDQDGLIKIWDVESASEVMTLCGHKGIVYSVSPSPNGWRFVSGGADGVIKIWDSMTGREVMTLSGGTGGVDCVAFSSGGETIVSGGDDRTIRVWDALTGHLLMSMPGHQDGISSIGFSSTGDRFVSCSWDGYVKTWDSSTGEELTSSKVHEKNLTSVSFMPDDQRIVAGVGYHYDDIWGREVKIWDVTNNKEVKTFQCINNVNDIKLSPDCTRLLAATIDGVLLWDLEGGVGVLKLKSEGSVRAVDISRNGRHIAMGGANNVIVLLELKAPIGGYEPRINAETARKLVDQLHDECGTYREVLKTLEADTEQDESVRKFGLQITSSRLGQDSLELAQ